jgi:four helix bundle protein
VGDFKKLEAWQVAHQTACDVYRVTASFPRAEMYGLAAQLRRSAVSIAANIAEGCGRNGDAELRRFLRISLGSATELEYHLLLSRDVGLLDAATHAMLSEQATRIQSMLAKLRRSLSPVQRIANSE